MTEEYYVACDLGAESGRVIVGRLVDGKLQFEEIHRFANRPVSKNGSLHWDANMIFEELKVGLQIIADRDYSVASISVDSWGVDYALVGKDGQMLAEPFNYRDSRTDSVYAKIQDSTKQNIIFPETGIQFMQINTLYQLISEKEQNSDQLSSARCFLTIADFFNYRLSGVAKIEESLASTTQLFNPITRNWSTALTNEFELPETIFPPLCTSGSTLGPLLPELRFSDCFANTKVVATCSHDTGAAVAAIPAVHDQNWAFLSSGTWSLLGVELQQPMITETALDQNFTNEAGYGGTTRFLQNMIGLWILQECRRQWSDEGNHLEYAQITELASEVEPLRSLIDPNADRFLKPGDMPIKIVQFCEETDQPIPETPGQFARCILESLALLYSRNLKLIEQMTGLQIDTLHIVGGGSNNKLLNQFTADATARSVIAGPVEATAIGNLLIQAISLGDLESLAQLRDVVRNSFEIETYNPNPSGSWQDVGKRFSLLDIKK